MLHLLHLRQLPVVETAVTDTGQKHLFTSLLNAVECHLLFEAEDVAHVDWVFVVEIEIVDELLPNVLIFGDGLEEGERLELPPIPRTSAFSVTHPTPGDDPAASRLHLALLDEIYPANQ